MATRIPKPPPIIDNCRVTDYAIRDRSIRICNVCITESAEFLQSRRQADDPPKM